MADSAVLEGPVVSSRSKTPKSGAMLDLWRPPRDTGEPVGCLSTTYTFAPGLFDEQCLARFLAIESEPNREDLAFLLERESRLGSVYAGVLVDHTQAGVEHSLRWDVLPVRIPEGKQHAKLSLLSWGRHVRVIVASANLTEPGYRTNHEVAVAVELTPEEGDVGVLTEAVAFLRALVALVPGASKRPAGVRRAEAFLDQIERQVQGWEQRSRRRVPVSQHLIVTLPADGAGRPARSSLEQAVEVCRKRWGSPDRAWVASPFFDADGKVDQTTAALCKFMSRGGRRELRFCVPAVRGDKATGLPRLSAPKALLLTPALYQGKVTIATLPEEDRDRNLRLWHAKMLALSSAQYSALMTGSSNFTCAGMGVGRSRNAEANLLTIVDRVAYNRDAGRLEAVWPELEVVSDPDAAEWLGRPETDEEEQAAAPRLPQGFLSATYRAGDLRQVVLQLDPPALPEDWRVCSCGRVGVELLTVTAWHESGSPHLAVITWASAQPPEKLLVRWPSGEAFLSLNVEDSRELPAPAQLEQMSAEDLLWILAATDPGAAFRVWARRQQPSETFDPDLDAATPLDLDPLRRYDLQATFLHRVRRRARILAQLRANLERPVWGRAALEWRLRGLIGIELLADRLARECFGKGNAVNEAVLTLADLLIVLREVNYQPTGGALSKPEFEEVFRPFLRELAERLGRQLRTLSACASNEVVWFWARVVDRCRE